MLPHPDTREFLIVGFRFFAELFAEFHAEAPPSLARPINEDFPFPDLAGHELVAALFGRTAELVGVDPEQYALAPHASREQAEIRSVLPGGNERSFGRHAAGTYSVAPDGRPVITYEESTIDDTDGLVATFAHELSHDLLHVSEADFPGPEEADEHLTDLASAYLGFGIFGANSAYRFQHVQDGLMVGWRTSQGGYLTVVEWGYALALFAHLHEVPMREVRKHLSSYAEPHFVHAHREIADHRASEIAAMRTRVPIGSDEIARCGAPRFGEHVSPPSLLGRLFGR